MSNYEPIHCTQFDYVEDFITRKVYGTIIYKKDNDAHTIQDQLVDWENENGTEYAITKSGLKIRMDKIVKLFDKEFK